MHPARPARKSDTLSLFFSLFLAMTAHLVVIGSAIGVFRLVYPSTSVRAEFQGSVGMKVSPPVDVALDLVTSPFTTSLPEPTVEKSVKPIFQAALPVFSALKELPLVELPGVREPAHRIQLPPRGPDQPLSPGLVRLLQKVRARRDAAEGGATPALVRPRVLEKVLPEYPRYAREEGIEGSVTMKVEILKDGSCGEVEVVASSVDRNMTDLAVKAMNRWRFQPLTVGGVPRVSFAELKLRYGLHG